MKVETWVCKKLFEIILIILRIYASGDALETFKKLSELILSFYVILLYFVFKVFTKVENSLKDGNLIFKQTYRYDFNLEFLFQISLEQIHGLNFFLHIF